MILSSSRPVKSKQKAKNLSKVNSSRRICESFESISSIRLDFHWSKLTRALGKCAWRNASSIRCSRLMSTFPLHKKSNKLSNRKVNRNRLSSFSEKTFVLLLHDDFRFVSDGLNDTFDNSRMQFFHHLQIGQMSQIQTVTQDEQLLGPFLSTCNGEER